MEFFAGDLAVAVLIELGDGFGGILDFLGGKRAVMIGVDGLEQRRWRWWWLTMALGWTGFLGADGQGGGEECQELDRGRFHLFGELRSVEERWR